jgi:hypothetical protein
MKKYIKPVTIVTMVYVDSIMSPQSLPSTPEGPQVKSSLLHDKAWDNDDEDEWL